MWECEWLAIKKNLVNKIDIEKAAKAQNINIRDALFGGRTECFKSYHECVGKQVINYDDVTSLYPTVNALDDYPVGFKKYVTITPKDILSGKFFGLVKVDVTPPKDLYVPVLPQSVDGKLLFHLNDMTGTWFSHELKYALERGYVITKIHAALKYDKFPGLMKAYVGDFIQMKIENEKELTQDECDSINKYHHNLGFKFVIKLENCKTNEGMRQVAKICLNSLWGKFGQRTNLSSYDFISEYTVFVRNLHDPKIQSESWQIINENCVELRYIFTENTSLEPEFISEITAVATTANARLRLYDFISWLHPSQLIYCDTDSCVWLYDEENPLHKKRDNNDPTLPKSIQFGSGLGQWKDELEGDHITEIVAGGAKSYSYKLDKGIMKKGRLTKCVVKQKGITLDVANACAVNFDTLKHMVLNDETLQSVPRYQFQWDKKSKNIITGQISRSIHSTINSKRDLDGYDTTPFGYKRHKII